VTSPVETDVLIVGTGPAGASAAVFLSTLGVPNVVVTKFRWTANTPRAHITNQRTMEILRDVGLQAEVEAKATPNELMGDTVFCTSLAGEELARLHTWGTHPRRFADYRLASPTLHNDTPQDILEPILCRRRGRARLPGPVRHRVPLARSRTPTASRRRSADRVTARRTRSARST
jgi:2,4-dichlorophenol 6-monooxygenase